MTKINCSQTYLTFPEHRETGRGVPRYTPQRRGDIADSGPLKTLRFQRAHVGCPSYKREESLKKKVVEVKSKINK